MNLENRPTPEDGMAPASDAPSPPAGIRAIRMTLLAMAGCVVVLGVLGTGLAAMSGDALDPWPGLTMMLVGQAGAIPALAASLLALRRAVAGRDPGASGVRRVLRLTAPVLLGVLLVAVAAWMWAAPGAWLSTVACALVAAQVAIISRLLSR
ncbi:MAG: hypothetical protein ACTHW7_00865 [Actinomycetaceae bacterium]